MPLSQIVSDSIQDGAVTPVDLSSVAQYYGFKNRLINGAFGIWQRGTSGFTTLGNYSADRWIVSGTTNSAVAQSSDVPTGFKYSLSITGTGYPQTYQRIESVNCTDLVGQNVTISFWAKQTGGTPGANSVAAVLYSPTAADNYTSVNTLGSAGFTGSASWTYYSFTVSSLPASAANGLQVLVYANTAGAATILFTGVQLEKGVTATSFDYRPYGTELQLCQRYYEKSYDIDVVPGTATVNGLVLQTVYFSSVNQNGALNFKVPKRAAPTMTYYDSAGTAGRGTYAGSGTWYTGQPVTGLSSCQTGATQLVTGAGYGTSPSFVHFTASAEL